MWGRVSIGLHRDVEVITPGAPDGQQVAQAFCSALPVAYGNLAADNWRAFATLVLAAAYKPTLLATALQAANGGSNVVLLTPLGGAIVRGAADRGWARRSVYPDRSLGRGAIG